MGKSRKTNFISKKKYIEIPLIMKKIAIWRVRKGNEQH